MLALLLAIALHLDVQGKGSPTVILESGFGGDSTLWTNLQPEVAKFARVVAYDRAGLGKSAASTEPRTATQIVEELRAALQAANIEPPYVLVGQSSGGASMRVFAAA